MGMTEEEYIKKMEDLEVQKKAFEEKLKQKPPLYKRMWFWVTCWRPVTKLEAAHTAQAIVANRRLVNSVVVHVNRQSLKMRDIILTLNKMNVNVNVNEAEKKSDKDDVMIQ